MCVALWCVAISSPPDQHRAYSCTAGICPSHAMSTLSKGAAASATGEPTSLLLSSAAMFWHAAPPGCTHAPSDNSQGHSQMQGGQPACHEPGHGHGPQNQPEDLYRHPRMAAQGTRRGSPISTTRQGRSEPFRTLVFDWTGVVAAFTAYDLAEGFRITMRHHGQCSIHLTPTAQCKYIFRHHCPSCPQVARCMHTVSRVPISTALRVFRGRVVSSPALRVQVAY